MAQRILIGEHPSGGMGMFISRAGVDVGGADTYGTDNMLFSSNWTQVAKIVAQGQCLPDQSVNIPDQGFIPLIRWEAYRGSMVDTLPILSLQFKSGDNFVSRRLTRYRVNYYSGTMFQINRQRPDIDDGSGFSVSYDGIRYVVFNVPVDRNF